MHHYDETVPDWDADDLPQRAALDARLAELVTQHIDEDPLWPNTVTILADDLIRNDDVRAALTRFCILVGNILVCNHGGRTEAVAALKQAREQLLHIATGAAE